MREIAFLLLGTCLGTFIGLGLMFALMGPKLRDQYMGRNQENKPIVIDWIGGRDPDVNIMMRGIVIFTGKILNMNIGIQERRSRTVHIELVDKAEVMREFRS